MIYILNIIAFERIICIALIFIEHQLHIKCHVEERSVLGLEIC